jgi:hypothetical protein
MRGDLDEFRLQLALGKAETIDKFEEVKKTFKDYLNTLDVKLEGVHTKNQITFQKLRQKLDELQVQLALGKAEGKDAMERQKKNLASKLHELENLIIEDDLGDEIEFTFREEIERFRMKLDLLRVKANLGQHELRDEWMKRKKELNENLSKWKAKSKSVLHEGKEKLDVFGTEVTEAFTHLKKAFGVDH